MIPLGDIRSRSKSRGNAVALWVINLSKTSSTSGRWLFDAKVYVEPSIDVVVE